MKFKIRDTVYFVFQNKIRKGIVVAFKYSDYTTEYFGMNSLYLEESIERDFPKNVEVYSVKDDDTLRKFSASDLFASKEELLAYLEN